MKMKILKISAIIICAFYIGFLSVSHATKIPYERDEISWYFHTKFFDEAFIKKNISSPLWYGYESFDHPQVSKYIYGAYLYAQNHDYFQLRDSLEAKYGRWAFYTNITSDEAITQTEFVPILHNLRTINLMTLPVIVILIYALFFQLSSSTIFSLAIVAILSTHPLFIYSTAIVTSDNHFLLFGLLAMYLYVRSIKSKHVFWIVSAAVASALATGSKLTGVFIAASIPLHESLRVAFAHIPLTVYFKRIGVFVTTLLLYWIFINPALYLRPLQGTWKYFSFRSFQSANIAYHVPTSALTTFKDKSDALVCTLFLHSCRDRFVNGSLTQVGILNIGLFALGLYFGFKQFFNKNNFIRYWLTLGYLFSMAYLTTLANYTNRYYILPQIIVFFIQMFGVWGLFHSLRVRRK